MEFLEFSTHKRETKTVMELRTRFFKYHSDRIKKSGWPRPALVGLNPNALVLNPPQFIDEHDPFSTNTYFAVYCRGYYVTIEQSDSNPFLGPHVAKLNLQLFPREGRSEGRTEWLGTAQFACSFFDEKAIRITLRRAIRTRLYFVSEETERIEICLTRPEAEESIDI